MILFKKADQLSEYIQQLKSEGTTIGFVPTMGALHAGHLELIKTSKENTGITVCSIFINPTQFNNKDDLKNYPVTIERDIEQLLSSNCDVLFLPSAEEMYPSEHQKKQYDIGYLEHILEGAYRPGHFQGVCEVVDRLLKIVQPHKMYLGQKDLQQCFVINRLLEITDRKKDLELIISPTVREPDGLAMSSRNLRLTPEQRTVAPAIHETLQNIRQHYNDTSSRELISKAKGTLFKKGFNVDYIEIADAQTLKSPPDPYARAVALIAAKIGNIRLIDNLFLN